MKRFKKICKLLIVGLIASTFIVPIFDPFTNIYLKTKLNLLFKINNEIHRVKELQEQLKYSIAMLYKKGLPNCSGSFIELEGKDDLFILTAKHCVFSPFDEIVENTLEFIALNNIVGTANLYKLSHTEDLAILKVIKLSSSIDIVILKLAEKDAEIDESIIICGAPRGIFPYCGQGIAGQYIETDGELLQFMTSRDGIYPGHSGSPVINMNGELIGVLTRGHAAVPIVGIMVPRNTITTFVNPEKDPFTITIEPTQW